MRYDLGILIRHVRGPIFGGRVSQQAVDGIRLLLETMEHYKVQPIEAQGNVLAQVGYETAHTFAPVKETTMPHHKDRNPSDEVVKARLEKAYPNKRTKYWRNGFFGRGLIQLTHDYNYEKMGRRFKIDLKNNPSWALDPKWSAHIAVVGMLEGLFTGKKLSDYFSGSRNDPRGARAIVNGSDRAEHIAALHAHWVIALKKALLPMSGAAAQDRPVNVEAENVRLSKEQIMELQLLLREKGYPSVGLIDGKFGPNTQGAIVTFQEFEGIPVTKAFDPFTVARLKAAQPRPPSPERASRTMEDLRKGGAQVVVQADKVTFAQALQGVLGFLGTVGSAALGLFGENWEKTALIRSVFTNIPGPVWGMLIGVIATLTAIYTWRRAESVKKWRLDDERTGRHNGVVIDGAKAEEPKRDLVE